jgi:hypothetical protein
LDNQKAVESVNKMIMRGPKLVSNP